MSVALRGNRGRLRSSHSTQTIRTYGLCFKSCTQSEWPTRSVEVNLARPFNGTNIVDAPEESNRSFDEIGKWKFRSPSPPAGWVGGGGAHACPHPFPPLSKRRLKN